ncbi:lon protease-like protein [Lophium mytilinum]|uniref:Lon protease homolog, mitochondrial n=1 Tax=Lophium mytilinum TaxID=390894 RepID=A0A6A6QAF2_9PEZI|nr:lon protease-like protein [Lophium mytilinum]
MLCGQRQTWRAALQHASRTSYRQQLSSSSPVHCARRLYSISPAQYSTPLERCRLVPSSLNNTRNFSSSATWRKDKSTKPPPDVPESDEVKEAEEDGKDNTEPEARERKDLEKSTDAKSKTPDPIPSSKSAEGKSATAGGNGAESGATGEGGAKRRRAAADKAVAKPSPPEVYPQVMAIPITKRPMFPGFYKAITIKNREVAKALSDMMSRGQPYIGAFMFKDDNADKDTINSPDEIYDVGTFCQITSLFTVPAGQNSEAATTAVLYPHRRIKMTSLIKPNYTGSKEGDTSKVEVAAIKATLEESTEKAQDEPAEEKKPESEDNKGDVVASFEETAADSQKLEKPDFYYEPTAFLRERPVTLINVENIPEQPYERTNMQIRALVSEIVNTFKEVANLNNLFRDQVSAFSNSQNSGNVGEEPGKLADFAASVAQAESAELQEIMDEEDMQTRLTKALTALKKELMNAQLQKKIVSDVESKIHKKQREYWLMEQMKGIKRELGLESDGKEKLIQTFQEKANRLSMPEAVKKVFDEELSKLAHLEQAASEFNVTRNYLDWLTQMPWGQRSAENFGIKHAMTVLDEDHYGLKDVKDRILEFIAVGKLRGTVEGKILCMVGPPGVGKTSIGKSIARALGRQYYRFSVGGLADVAEIKGHRRTYVGALPGRIIQALKKVQTENPLILIDEVDKIGKGHNGDPSSALLELLDPEQNNSFLDHYMDVPVDLSKVLFVCTANMTDTIPRPLLDRMELIELSGYVADEKMAIADRYLAPAAKQLSGLDGVDVQLENSAIVELINKYCRESGVRNLKKQIEKVYRKASLKIVQDIGEDDVLSEAKALTEEGKAAQEEAAKDETDVNETSQNIANETTEIPRIALKVPDSVHVSITKDNLADYVGPPVFTSDRIYETTPPGVAMGLAWTQMGGAALYVESIIENALSYSSHPGLQQTGNLRPVMKESVSIAYSFAKGVIARDFPKNRFFEHARVHLHCPEGAVPKDGPSAGITMATSLLSLAINEPLDPTIAMTGELTVTGKVLRIGGLREKTVAARRAGAKMIIFPEDNLSDWLELPENIKAGIAGKPVGWYRDVFGLVFPGLDREAANALWKKELKKPKGASARKALPQQQGEEAEVEEAEEED